jgi:hypothetical protein
VSYEYYPEMAVKTLSRLLFFWCRREDSTSVVLSGDAFSVKPSLV